MSALLVASMRPKKAPLVEDDLFVYLIKQNGLLTTFIAKLIFFDLLFQLTSRQFSLKFNDCPTENQSTGKASSSNFELQKRWRKIVERRRAVENTKLGEPLNVLRNVSQCHRVIQS